MTLDIQPKPEAAASRGRIVATLATRKETATDFARIVGYEERRPGGLAVALQPSPLCARRGPSADQAGCLAARSY
jgi:hypothetical protein